MRVRRVRVNGRNRPVISDQANAVVTAADELCEVVLCDLPVDVLANELEGIGNDAGQLVCGVSVGRQLSRAPALGCVLQNVA